MNNKSTIEVNGKRYDAVTGAVLGVTSAPAPHAGRNIDGFFRSRTTASKTPSITEKISVLAPTAPEPKPHKQPQRTVNHARAHTPQTAETIAVRKSPPTPQLSQKHAAHRTAVAANHTKAHVTQNSQTLMRKSVQRPAPSLYKQVGTQGSLQHGVPSLVVAKQAFTGIDPTRLARAQDIARSPQIAHHGAGMPVKPLFTQLSVQPVPEKPEEQVPDTTPAPHPPTNKPDLFEQAIANASHFIDTQAHKKHFKKQARKHFTSMAAGTLALLVIAGFAAYQNTPGLQFKVASIQAGVGTSMPNLKAAGFAYSGVKGSDGKLTVGFSNNAGQYQLVQQTTNLSGNDMIHNIGATDASGTPNYQTVQAGGTTIYRFANTEATWVSGGKWYTVTGTGALSDDQVASLVRNS